MMQSYPKMDVTLQKKEAKIRRKGTKLAKKGSTAKGGSTKVLLEEPQAVVVSETATTPGQ